MCENADQRSIALRNRNAGDFVAVHQFQRFGERLARCHGDGVYHHARFNSFDRPDRVGLFFDRKIAV